MSDELLASKIFYCTARIEIQTKEGSGCGTGFFLMVEKDGNRYPFLVSNKHVIENAERGFITFLLDDNNKPVPGRSYTLTMDKQNWDIGWRKHTNPSIDIAVLPLGEILQHMHEHGPKPYIRFLHSDSVPHPSDLDQLSALEKITFVGYPDGRWDTKNFLPIVRTGQNASRLEVDFCGRPEFLIDASVFEGSSGSPVLIINDGMYNLPGGGIAAGVSRTILLGIISQTAFTERSREVTMDDHGTGLIAHQTHHLDLGVVVKSHIILEFINEILAT